MRGRLQSVSRILSLVEKLWFSDTLMRIFIIFPAGMWTMMLLCVTISCLEPGNPWYIFSLVLFLVLSLITVLLGFKRTWRNNGHINKN